MRERIIKLSVFGLVFALLMGGMGVAFALSNSGGEDWEYYREITIQEKSAKTLRGYQILLELNQSNFPSKANTDGSDLRFEKGGREYSYWIEDYDAGRKTGKIWVRIPNIPANEEMKVRMYYGNSKAVSMSNPEKTFDYWQSFEDGNLGDWTRTANGGDVVSERSYEGTYSAYVQDRGGSSGSHGGEGAIWSPNLASSLFQDKKRFEFSYQIDTWVNDGDNNGEGCYLTLMAYNPNGDLEWGINYVLCWDDANDPYSGTHTESGQYTNTLSPQGFRTIYLCDPIDSHNCEPEMLDQWHYHSRDVPDDMPIGATVDWSKVDHLKIEMGASGRDSLDTDIKYFIDFIKTRKYATPEPALTISKEYLTVPTPLKLTKTVDPSSIEQGDKTTVTITIENIGTTTIESVEVADTPSSDFDFIKGETLAKYSNLKPKESRTFQYTIESKQGGEFDLGLATATYTDEKGNYQIAKSNSVMVEVLPSPEEEIPGFEAVFVITGLLAVAFLIGRRERAR